MNETKLTPGCFIRHIYRGKWEYAIWNGDGTFTVIADQDALQNWKSGSKIEPLLYCNDEAYQAQTRRQKEQLRDGAEVIQIVWKKGKACPRKVIRA